MKSRVLTGRPLSRRLAVGSGRGLVRLGRRRRPLGVGDRDHRRPQDTVAAAETLPQHRRGRRHLDLGRRVVHDRLVQRRVEGITGGTERLDAEAVEQPQHPVGDELERTGQVAVVPGPLDVVDDREQLPGEPFGRLVDHQLAVAVDAAPVVGVLGGDPLQVIGALGQPARHVAVRRRLGDLRLDRLGDRRVLLAHLLPWVRARRGGRTAGGLLARRRPDLPRHRVDAPLVADDDPRRLLLRTVVAHFFSVSSSAISASTTSSSDVVAPVAPASPSVAAPPSAPAPAASACWAYIAPPTSWLTRATFSCAVLMASMSEPPSALRRSVSASPSSSFFSAGILSPFSARNFSVWYCRDSARLRVSASSRRFLSSSACASASFIIRSMSSLGRAEPPVMVIDCSLPVPRSLAVTCTMPLASMSKATSICGTPRGAGGRPVSSNMPSFLL